MEEGFNYGRFYALLKKMPMADKEELVYQFTMGRTEHLHLMTPGEYEAMCRQMERITGNEALRDKLRVELRRARSGVLHQMQLLGIDTTDWTRVNAFCKDKRIAGMEFRRIDIDGLNALNTKLRTIWHKGGLRGMKNEGGPVARTVVMTVKNDGRGC